MHFRSKKKSASDVYIDEPVDTDKDGNQLTLSDILGDGEDIIEKVDLSIRSSQLYKFLDTCLSPRELEIIKLRYGLYGCTPLTQREVAKRLDISRSYVKLAIYYKWMANVKITIATIHFLLYAKDKFLY